MPSLQWLVPHWARILKLCQGQTDQAVCNMQQTLSGFAAQLAQLPQAEIVELVASLNETLQYQDRQQQMLELLRQDLDAAAALSPEDAEGLDRETWIERFEARCPIPELLRKNPAAPRAAGAHNDPNLDFF